MGKKQIHSIIAKLHRSLGNDRIKQTFASVICEQMSDRTILTLDPRELNEFILLLYDFFILQHDSSSRIFLGKPKLNSPTLTNKLILKMSNQDASHLYITIEEILRKHQLRTTRRLHPIIGIKRDKSGKVIDIVSPTDSDERRSFVFIAFETLPDEPTLKMIHDDIKFHMQAVQESQKDSDKILHKLLNVTNHLNQLNTASATEWLRLIDWIKNHNFSFFGFHQISSKKASVTISNRLGICKRSLKIANLISPPSHIIEHANNEPFIVDRTTIMSPIQRFEPLMKVSFKFSGTQYVFYGILKRSSMYAKNIETPLIEQKMNYIFKKRKFLEGSYDFNEVIRIFNDIPKFELFRTTKEGLLEMVDDIMSITNTNHIQCFKKFNSKTNYLTIYFVIPYYFFNLNTVNVISEYICSQLDYSFHEILPITAPEKCRIHCHFRLNSPEKLPPEDTIERTLTQMVEPWEEQVYTHIMNESPSILNDDPFMINKIPSHYKVRTKASSAVRDLNRLLSLSESSPVLFEFFSFDYPKTSDLAGKASMLLVYHTKKLNLTNILPILHHLGIHVIDQITSRFGDSNSTIGFIHAFRILNDQKQKINEPKIKTRLLEALNSIFNNELPNDPLNQLILCSEMDKTDIFILQGIRNYAFQLLQSSFSLSKINQTLTDHHAFSEELISLFKQKFDPSTNKKTLPADLDGLVSSLKKYVKQVSSISDDQILRRFLSIVHACVRTNLFIKSSNDPLSFKFNCSLILGMPTPIPFMETFVFDQYLEGVHIRFGKVARGGLRWSSRIEDYRTEVLGLVKTQQTKNAVIIPVGSKGGFVIKEQPVTNDSGVTQYKRFITAMLQLTDNLLHQKRSTHEALVTYDEFDPYFVVAADKGTATFSDYANGVSLDRNFWMGDGFASGGKNGYDHKKVGITAKGAWECCKLHFKSMGQHPEKDPLRVVGIGDMSGDVFGNGMLLSKSIQLVAAFNHQHIFIDPNPDPLASWNERQRLFKRQRSSWLDYNGISAGGGVFDRSAKTIKCSKEMKEALSLTVSSLSGEELIKEILRSKVDLIWFGGIGTYIKSSSESNLDVGDPSNNNVRINAHEVQATVISEGANLGLTQLARIEYEQNNGRINTDAIDNSAGVNMSDYEVNIKILLSSLLASGKIKTDTHRNKALNKATNEVTKLVLKNNTSQHILISMDQYRSYSNPIFIEETIHQLIKEQRLSLKDEQIPNLKERANYYQSKKPLPRSVLAKCQAYTKMKLKEIILNSSLFDATFYDEIFFQYFPKSIQSFISLDSLPKHPLKKEIIITQITNHVVGLYGSSTYEKITIGNTINISRAVHYIMLLDSIFNFNHIRTKLLTKASDSQNKDLIQVNDILLQCVLICHLLNIKLNPNQIDDYKKIMANQLNSINDAPSLCFLLSKKHSKGAPAKRLKLIDQHLNLVSQIQIILDLPIPDKAHYQEQISIMTDLIFSLNDLMLLTDKKLQSLFLDHADQMIEIRSKADRSLSQLFIYSFQIRQFIKTISI